VVQPGIAMAGTTAHIIQSLVANLCIAAAKGVGAAITGSGAMLAETLHSFADCGNQGLLLLGVRKSQRRPSATHPLGYGRVLYFWSFMVALLLFTGGGVFSLYEGIHKLRHPEPVEDLTVAIAILAFSLALEGWSTWSNVVELNARRKQRPFFKFLQESKDSDLIVVFGENAAAVLGLVLALVSLLLASATGDGRWDAVGTLGIGAVLIAVAVFLAVEVQSLIVGEAADADIAEAARAAAADDARITGVLNLITVQQGPGEVIVSIKLGFVLSLTIEEVSRAINEFEERLRSRVPGVRCWCFVEPDIPRT
jgi:cation diffusion facilitator family transporter